MLQQAKRTSATRERLHGEGCVPQSEFPKETIILPWFDYSSRWRPPSFTVRLQSGWRLCLGWWLCAQPFPTLGSEGLLRDAGKPGRSSENKGPARVNAHPEVIPKKCGSVRVGDNTPTTRSPAWIRLLSSGELHRGPLALIKIHRSVRVPTSTPLHRPPSTLSVGHLNLPPQED
jgi:hypothetical protein